MRLITIFRANSVYPNIRRGTFPLWRFLVWVLQVPEVDEANVQVVLRLRVPDSHSDCPLGEKYGAAEEACSELVRLKEPWNRLDTWNIPSSPLPLVGSESAVLIRVVSRVRCFAKWHFLEVFHVRKNVKAKLIPSTRRGNAMSTFDLMSRE